MHQYNLWDRFYPTSCGLREKTKTTQCCVTFWLHMWRQFYTIWIHVTNRCFKGCALFGWLVHSFLWNRHIFYSLVNNTFGAFFHFFIYCVQLLSSGYGF
ncbi:uncharacterized protein LOC116801609 [Drosophila sechellia]|uniref:uncharacterized protein LOC116801609 n=1 Tax=Drosophila sechellia TaxID=7238 RepID=UPI0013DE4B29|nr:uncharacterized protein LOC116801609 [Drosophila sechellia]